jgi:hypothetical protein
VRSEHQVSIAHQGDEFHEQEFCEIEAAIGRAGRAELIQARSM